MTYHRPPSRLYVIDIVRRHGARAAYGAAWPHTDADTIAMLFGISDAEYIAQCGCDHHDGDGNCLGHRRGRPTVSRCERDGAQS
jgi:hypothetical protein